jgi:predicted ArsR family transcriptional regulator
VDRDLLEAQVNGLSVLDHPVSRRVYQFVLEHGEVSRDTAAQALAVARSVAAFHLDKLVGAGLLQARYLRLSGRTGPGAGRPAKLYARSAREIDLSIPPRRYDLAGAVLAEAISRSTAQETPIAAALSQAARETGARIGAACAAENSNDTPRVVLLKALDHQGYEPQDREGEIAMVNCPFHSLAEGQRNLVCGMNLDLITGVLEGIGETGSLTARLAPEAGNCCVRVIDG